MRKKFGADEGEKGLMKPVLLELKEIQVFSSIGPFDGCRLEVMDRNSSLA
jgi:hypothetical protein